MSLAWIPKVFWKKFLRICFKFLWIGNGNKHVIPWVNWKKLVVPKMLGGWGLKNIFLFAKALATKLVWRLVKTKSLCTVAVSHKYIMPISVKEWICNPIIKVASCSIIWKVVVSCFHVLGEGLAWHIGDDT